jgi:DNA repair exonuclease SbcCD ATPase subunit
MRHRRAVIVAGTIALLSPMFTSHSRVYAQAEGPMAAGKRDEAAAAANLKDKNFDPSTISKAILEQASRLKNDAGGWSQKLQDLDLDLKKNQQDVEATGKDIDECLVVLRAAADRLAPDAEARLALRKQEAGVRDLAIRAEVHSDPEIRKQAGFFQQKTTELRALNRSVEETRTRLVTQIDRLEELKVQLEFNRAAVQIGEAVKGGEASLDNIQTIVADAQRLASDLDSFGKASATAATKPADAAKPVVVDPRKRR